MAACMAQSLTYPLDTIRRRIQTQGYLPTPLSSSGSGNSPSSATIRQTYRLIIATEGMRGLFKGLTVNWMRVRETMGVTMKINVRKKESLLLRITRLTMS